MKIHILSLFLCLCPLCLWAQQSQVKVSSERTAKNEMVIWAENYSHMPHTITLRFGEVNNTTTVSANESRKFVVGSGKRRLMSLRPIDAKGFVSAPFRSYTEIGNTIARPDTSFVYLLPLRPGSLTQCNVTSALEGFLDKDKEKRTNGLVIRTREGDTIVAARGGIVTDLNDRSVPSSQAGRVFARDENYVQVYHADGSFALYQLFQDGGIFVNPGDEVHPGQPLGVIGGSHYQNGSHLRFTVYNWEEVATNDPDKYRKRSHFLFPKFWLGEHGIGFPEKGIKYTVEHPEEYILSEMSKKEKKKYLAGK